MSGIGELPQWVGYKTRPKMKDGQPVLKANGKPKLDKIPMNPHTGGQAQTNNPATWTDYYTAVEAVERYDWAGVGFVFTQEAGVIGIDLDDCVNEDGSLSDYAQRVLRLLNSYAEYSPSGDGVHILVKGTIPRAAKKGQIEIYSSGRFFTYTGNRVPGYDVEIRERQAALDQLFAEATREEQSKDEPVIGPVAAANLDDQTLLDRARRAKNGAKFDALWRGNWAGYASQSEADDALCHLLAFWTGKDAAAMDRLFRQSGLFREKWDERHYGDGTTYGAHLIRRAIANTTEVYEPSYTPGGSHVNGHGPVAAASYDDDSLMPPLPKSAWIDPAIGQDACPWLDEYVAFSRRMSPRGFDDFHEAVALWLLSTVAARRLMVQLGTKSFYPNLFITLCAHTTIHAKTTTARVGRNVLQGAGLAHLLLPDDLTPQAFVNELVLRLPPDYNELSTEQQEKIKQRLAFAGQRGWFYEEFGTKVQAMMRDSGTMTDFRGLLRVFDDNAPEYEYMTMTRRDRVERPYLALLANMTPADIMPFAKPGSALWRDGFWARWAFVTPPLDLPPQFSRFPDEAEAVPTTLIEPLRRWHMALRIPQVNIKEIEKDSKATGKFTVDVQTIQPFSCAVGPGVLDVYYAYHNALVLLASEQAKNGHTDLTGNYGRFGEKAMRIAMLLAGISNQNRIEMAHWARAQAITERWRENLHSLAEQVTNHAPSEEKGLQDKVIDILNRHGSSTAAEIGRNIRGVSGPEVDDICKRLVKSGVLCVVETTRQGTNKYGLGQSVDK